MTITINKKNLVCSPTHLVVTRPLLAFSGVALATPENAHSPQPTAHSPQPTAHSPQPTAHSPLTYNINFINTS